MEKERKGLKKLFKFEDYNDFNKFLIHLLVIFTIFTIVLSLAQFLYVGFSNYMWIKVNRVLFDYLYKVNQSFSFLVPYGDIIFISSCGIIIVLNIVITIVFRNNIKGKHLAKNILLPFTFVVLSSFLLNVYYYFSSSSHKGINEIYMSDKINAKYDDVDLVNLIHFFKNEIIIYSESLYRENGTIVVEGNPYEIVLDDLYNLSSKYDFLIGSFPDKIRTLSEKEISLSNYPLAMTYNFSVGIDSDNITDLNKLFVLTHELCHVKGIYRESDANYCAFLAGYNSDYDVSKYSMYLNIFTDLLSILKDKDVYNNIENELGSLCLESGYDEICNLYDKDTNRFKEKSDHLNVYTYSLSTYKNNKEEIKQYLLGLKNRFNVSIKMDSLDEIDLEKAYELIDMEDDHYLTLVSEIDKKTYNDNKEYLKTISNYFPQLFLNNSKEKKEDYSSFDYLKPFPTGTFVSFTSKEPEFGYNRSVRSILEYFDKYVYN